MGAAALPVDVGPIGGVAQDSRLGPQQREQLFRRSYRGAVGAIHQHPHAFQLFRHGGGQILSVLYRRLTVLTAGAYLLRLHRDHGDIPVQQHPLYFIFLVIGQLVALRAKDLDAVELVGVVGGRNDHAGRGLFLHGQVGHRRGGNHPQQHHIGAAGHQAARQGRLQHLAGKPGIPADDHGGAFFGVLTPDHLGQCHAYFLRPADGKIPVGNAADAVCSKQSAHINSSRFLSWFRCRHSSGNAPKWGDCGGSAAGRPPPFWAARCCG